jgi:fructose-specific PTS system IIA-like component
MLEIPFSFPLKNGLHARPACLLQEVCRGFKAEIRFRNGRNGRRADAKSVLALMASDTAAGDPCRLEISGPEQDQALLRLRDFVGRELPRADDGLPPPAAPSGRPGCLPRVFRDGDVLCFKGRSMAPGIARARAVLIGEGNFRPRRFASGKADVQGELRLFRSACRALESGLLEKAAAATDLNAAGVLRAHLAILSDADFQGRIASLIQKNKMPAGRAIRETAAHLAEALQGARSAYLQERASDIFDLAGQLIEKLYPAPAARNTLALSGAAVVVADNLPPSRLLALDPRHLRGLVLGNVGATSHVAILARALAIPSVSALTAVGTGITAGDELIVDGTRGLVIRKPGPALKRYYRLEQRRLRQQARKLSRLQKEPARTADGLRLEIAANIGCPAELAAAWQAGAEGIGLFRSETLFLNRKEPPGEEFQFAAYRAAARSARGKPVIVRTLDIGGDKPLPYLALPREENPFLGYRAVRFYAEHQDLIRCQLRAILRAARFGRLKVMVPMVTSLDEIRLVRRLLQEAAAELRAGKIAHRPDIELGVMVETPAAALFLGQLGREADFFSIGSNDLLQFFLAIDRGNARLGSMYDPLHPAFLSLLAQAAVQARAAKRWLGMCGEMAGDPDFLPLLVGLGLDEISLAAGLIPQVKDRLRQLEAAACRSLLQEAVQCSSAAEVADLLSRFNNNGLDAPVIAGELIRLDAASRTKDEAIKELCDLLELSGRVRDSHGLEEVIWQREEVYTTDLGFAFAIPHGKSPCVRAASIAFLRPRRQIPWGGAADLPVQAVLLIAVPADDREQEHLKLIARLSRRLMHEDFRKTLLQAKGVETVLAAVRAGIGAS